jgi:hypothetical protein
MMARWRDQHPDRPSRLEPAASVTARTNIELLGEQRRTNELLTELVELLKSKG